MSPDLIPLMVVLVPLLTAVAVALWGRVERMRNGLALAGSVVSLALVTWVYAGMRAGAHWSWKLAGPLGTPLGLHLRFDGLGAVFALIVAYLWLAATIYSWTYLGHGEDQQRYWVTWLVVLAGMLGVAGAANYVTLLVFFELMSLLSYVLVVHNQSPEAMAAGETYLYMSVFGGVALLTGTVAMQHFLGTTEIGPLAGQLAALPAAARWSILGLLGTGFGVKAGALPLHVWLPKAHPVAPSPASALLSGVMIKAGAFGFLRTVVLMLTPAGGAGGHADAVGHMGAGLHAAVSGHEVVTAVGGWELARTAGLGLIWLAVVTMLAGVTMALLQQNAKRMLAYHSISQMGYILLGTGIAAYLGPEGAIGFGGALMHLINHALFKGCLFLAVGAVLLHTGEVNMYRLGGMWREMPFTAVACLIAAAGISGVPGLNGYASKTLLHHAVVEAAHAGPASLLWAERLFVLTGVGTAASFVKLYSLIFLGRRIPEQERVQGHGATGLGVGESQDGPISRPAVVRAKEQLPLKIGMALLAVMIVGIGLLPNLAFEAIIGPAAGGFGFDPHSLEHVLEVQVFTSGDILSVVTTILFGALVFFVGLRKGWFHLHGPEWLSIEWLAVKGGTAVGRVWLKATRIWERALTRVSRVLKVRILRAARVLPLFDYRPGRTEGQREFNLLNLDFDFYFVLVVIAAVLLLVGLWQIR